VATKAREQVDFEMNEMVGYLIRVSQQVHVQIWNDKIGVEGLTSPQFAVLHCLAHEEPLDQRALGERASLDRSTVADVIARLDRRGLLARRRDTVDGRRNLVMLTEDGRAVHRVAVRAARDVNESLLGSLSAEDSAALARILNEILRNHRDEITSDLESPRA
jgi:DNA-binding MarR family transcriptional regulator